MGQSLRFARLSALIVPLAVSGPAFAQTSPPPPPEPPSASADDSEEGDEIPVEDAPPRQGASEAGEGEPSDEEMLDELQGENPARPPPKGKGVIWGTVKETEFHETLVEAPVQVIGKKIQTLSDVEGRFRLELPPGTYSLRISYELHKSTRIDGVVVEAGKVIKLDFDLSPDKSAIDVLEVFEEADKSSLEGIILARQRSKVVGDSVGRAEISKTTDRNAAQAAQRVVGATVIGGRFVYVRGLGDRYTNALLNGVPLPSPEPDRAAVPLDLFPTGVLNSLTIAKTFTPDSPGDFAGGSVRIETREIPREPLFQVSLRGGYNTSSTFRQRLTHRGGSLDWLGLDDGTRSLPEGIPARNLERAEFTEEARTGAGRRLNSYMSAQRSGTPPDHGFSVVAGNGWDFGNDRKLGALGALSYGRSYTVRRDEIIRVMFASGRTSREFRAGKDYLATTGNDNVNWGGFGSLTYRFSANHQLSLVGLRSTLADNRTRYVHGYHEIRDQDIHDTQLSFVTRALNLAILSGEHRFPDLESARLDWNVVLSSATRDEPDRRDSVWGHGRQNLNSTYFFTDSPESGRHFFAEQTETQRGGGLNWTQPIGPRDTDLKFGGLVSIRDRSFESRTFRFRPAQRSPTLPMPTTIAPCQPGKFDACNDRLFVPANIGPMIALNESTKAGDSYDALLNIYAGYIMADLGVSKTLRVIAGERIEHTYQTTKPLDPTRSGQPTPGAKIEQTDLLPAVSAAWSPTARSKVRASAARTLARPQLRELADVCLQDYFGGRFTCGNPDLEMTKITNLDLRFESFPTLRDVLAVSIFFKDFSKPIEPIIVAAGDEGTLTFQNAEGAKVIGLELEARRNVAFVSETLRDFSVVTNLTLAHSRIEITEGTSVDLTNLSRPLVNQAPWVFNFAFDYANEKMGLGARLLYNVVGPRIVQVGTQLLDDVYEHPRHGLDATLQKEVIKHLQVKFEAKNLLNSMVLLTQGCGGRGLFGSTWQVSCSRGEDAAVSQYTEGVTLGVTGTYDF